MGKLPLTRQARQRKERCRDWSSQSRTVAASAGAHTSQPYKAQGCKQMAHLHNPEGLITADTPRVPQDLSGRSPPKLFAPLLVAPNAISSSFSLLVSEQQGLLWATSSPMRAFLQESKALPGPALSGSVRSRDEHFWHLATCWVIRWLHFTCANARGKI